MKGLAEVTRALDDALSVVKEFDGATIEVKLGTGFRLDAPSVASVAQSRWYAYAHDHGYDENDEQAKSLFCAAWTEALLTGTRL